MRTLFATSVLTGLVYFGHGIHVAAIVLLACLSISAIVHLACCCHD